MTIDAPARWNEQSISSNKSSRVNPESGMAATPLIIANSPETW